jgi:hypothetical protein
MLTRPVRCTNDENVLLGAHAVHFGEDLVDDTISGTASVAHVPTTSLGDRVQLVEKQHARSRCPSLKNAKMNPCTNGPVKRE